MLTFTDNNFRASAQTTILHTDFENYIYRDYHHIPQGPMS